MTVASILAEKGRDVFSLKPDTIMSNALDVLAQERIGAIVVVDGEERVCGILSERDVVRAISRSGASVLDKPISDHMTRAVISCVEADTIDHVMSVMTENRFRHVPVENGGKLVGIISIGDVVKRKIEQAERDAQELRNYIATG